jgi:pimeloyl-ACP methyl ester carboxylesterase
VTELAYTRRGSGPPLVLLHALGSARHSWDPVVPALAHRFDVIAIDLPGSGESPPLPTGTEPSPATLAATIAELLDELNITAPHIAGNSLGGWVALEFANVRPVASLTLLAPAGLWRHDCPRYCRVSLRTSRWLARYLTRPLCALMRFRLGRVLVLGQTHGRPAHMSPDQARAAIRALGDCPGFDATYRATLRRRFVARTTIDAPVTLGFGTRDKILLKRQSRHRDQLPPATTLAAIPRAGHLPFADDPAAVIALIERSGSP